MGSKISPLIQLLLCSLIFLQCLQITTADHINHLRLTRDNNPNKKSSDDDRDHDHHKSILSRKLNPELNVFFHYNTLKIGTKLPLYFPKKNPSKSPHLLSRQESNSIPFSSSRFPQILKILEIFPDTSKHALAMQSTLRHCESPPIKGETKFCATSLESMLDSVAAIFGPGSKVKALTTNYVTGSPPPLQNYTVVETPARISARRIAACHVLPYPYAVFYCHSQDSVDGDELYEVLLEGEDGGRVEAVAVCHVDTSGWDPRHVAFGVLETGPGGSPVCHFFPVDNLVWIDQMEIERSELIGKAV